MCPWRHASANASDGDAAARGAAGGVNGARRTHHANRGGHSDLGGAELVRKPSHDGGAHRVRCRHARFAGTAEHSAVCLWAQSRKPRLRRQTRSGCWRPISMMFLPRVIGYCFEHLFAAGALDVFSIPVQMKKNRPGVLLSVLAPEALVSALEEILFRETATFGVRRLPGATAQAPARGPSRWTRLGVWSRVSVAGGWGAPGVFTPEYEDCARIARQYKMPLREVLCRRPAGVCRTLPLAECVWVMTDPARP